MSCSTNAPVGNPIPAARLALEGRGDPLHPLNHGRHVLAFEGPLQCVGGKRGEGGSNIDACRLNTLEMQPPLPMLRECKLTPPRN